MLGLECEEGCGRAGLSLIQIGFDVVRNGTWIDLIDHTGFGVVRSDM